jgi:hypothetical protein
VTNWGRSLYNWLSTCRIHFTPDDNEEDDPRLDVDSTCVDYFIECISSSLVPNLLV